jgi:hypothetical protein
MKKMYPAQQTIISANSKRYSKIVLCVNLGPRGNRFTKNSWSKISSHWLFNYSCATSRRDAEHDEIIWNQNFRPVLLLPAMNMETRQRAH